MNAGWILRILVLLAALVTAASVGVVSVQRMALPPGKDSTWAADEYLSAVMETASGPLPPADEAFRHRFGGLDK